MKYLISLDIFVFTLEIIGKLVGICTASWFVICLPIFMLACAVIGVYVGLAYSAKYFK
nr:MAG TPA: hypothetical protein [Bacteriophage sp.]